MNATQDADVLIVGGGPVGLLLAALLGQAGKTVLLFEARSEGPTHSMAIGITPPSLDILNTLGLAEACARRGVRIRTAVVHENRREINRLDFEEHPDLGGGILSLPQADTMQLLQERLATYPTVRRLIGWRVTDLRQNAASVTLTASDPQYGVPHVFCAPLAAGCDGAHGHTAEWLGLRVYMKTYLPHFIMGDFRDRSGLGSDAHLFFGNERPIESFPLPGGRRRWIVRRGWRDRDDLSAPLAAAVTRLTGIPLDPADQLNASEFHPRYRLRAPFHRGRVALCGDAAHVMSPIGGQGMNTGFGDAAYLARAFVEMLDRDATVASWMRAYSRHRRSAFRRAAQRSALGMALGVAHGSLGSAFRRTVVRAVLGHRTLSAHAARWFTMRSLPDPIAQFAANGVSPHDPPDFSRRWPGVEIMDDPACDTRRLLRTVAQFRIMNRLVSRYHAILTRYVLRDLRREPDRPFHLIDIGAGGCDIPAWLLEQVAQRGGRLRVTAIDSDRRTVRFARARYGRLPGLRIERAALAELPRFGPADFVFCNHVLHHLPDDAIPGILALMDRTATRRWLVSDLRRSRAAYLAFGLLGPWFRDSYAFEDGRRSIRRSFIARELQAHARAVGLQDRVTIQRLCPSRLLMVGTPITAH